MTPEGYPDDHELELIEKWPYKNVFGLIDFVKERWCYNDAIKTKWGKRRYGGKVDVLYLELHTIGWSGNEDIINALMRNQMFTMWHVKWEVGGHWYFEIPAAGIGFIRVAEMAVTKGISRQYIHKNRADYEWITVGKRNQLVRCKTSTSSQSTGLTPE